METDKLLTEAPNSKFEAFGTIEEETLSITAIGRAYFFDENIFDIFECHPVGNPRSDTTVKEAFQKIAALEKQLEHQQLKVVVLDTLINVAEKQLNISIRKKPGTQQSEK